MSEWTVFVRQNVDRHLLVGALLCGAIVPLFSATESSLAAYLAGAAGLIALNERLRSEFPRSVAILTTLVIFLGTSLFWSMTKATSFVDSVVFGVVAALLFLSERLRAGRALIWMLVAAVPVAARYLSSDAPTTVFLAPHPNWAASLFSSSHGLLSLSPVAYLALVGTMAYARRNLTWAASALVVLAAWLAVHSLARQVPPTTGPFGHGLTAALATLAPGFAFILERARARPLLAIAPLVIVALGWNYWLMVQYTAGLVPKDAPVSFGDMVRQQADVHTRSPYIYPFAFPANVWFAWREKMPAERYEVLSVEPRRQAIDLAMDRSVDRFLLEGWDAPGPDDLGPVHWIGEPRATIALPLVISEDRPFDLTVIARARLEEPAVNAEMALELNGHDLGRFVVPASAPTEFRFRIPAPAVGHILRAGYNRLTFVSYGVHRADSGDERPPGPLASRPGNRAWPVAIYRIRLTPAS